MFKNSPITSAPRAVREFQAADAVIVLQIAGAGSTTMMRM